MTIKSFALTNCNQCPIPMCEQRQAGLIPPDCPLPDHITQVHARIADTACIVAQQLNEVLRECGSCSVCGKMLTTYRRGTCDDCLVEFKPEIIQMAKDAIDAAQYRKNNQGGYNYEAMALLPDLITIAHEVVRYSGGGE